MFFKSYVRDSEADNDNFDITLYKEKKFGTQRKRILSGTKLFVVLKLLRTLLHAL